ncbi:cyclin-dependent kinase 2-interacting protein-like [Clytia hemisphaerica]|uniref:cyclin-dependent kinase 2-interacting protein-like n=1 Tax=Clytia hemisphaerica TaxID=252671 RepID=UPI0034D6B4E6
MATPRKEIKTPIKARILSEGTPSPKTPRTPRTPTTVDSSIKRRFSDILVNLHKCVQIWETDNQDSFNTANTLINLYSQWNTVKDSTQLNDIVSKECKEKYQLKLIKTREDLLKQLKVHQAKLEKLITKMNGFKENIRAIYFLGIVSNDAESSVCLDESAAQDCDFNLEPVIFSTWTSEMFLHKIEEMLSCYTKEYIQKLKFYDLFLKFRVNEKGGDDTSKLSQCVSIWLHQPYLDDHCRFLLECMLVEAELK